MSRKVAITDFTFPDLCIEEGILQAAGAETVRGQCKSPEDLVPLVRDVDAVITQFAPVNAEVIGNMEKAKVIVRYGIGVDNVDLAAARSRGIDVCNVPDYCIDEVADHTLALILAATRCVVPNCLKVRRGDWGLAVPLERMRALANCTVGIVGFGRIGREVARRLQPFKCRCLVFDPAVDSGAIVAAGCEAANLDGLLTEADIVTLHCPSNDTTRHLLNAESIGTMKPDAILVNVGRGDLVEPNALIEALRSGALSGAVLDVFSPEPIPADSPILQMDNVVVGSHIASASVPAARKLRETAATIAALSLRGEPLPNIVN
jgi:D-3-phosphoglycerate dehydrogenase